MLKKGKTGNHNGQQNRKTDLENGQNRKTESPNAPLFTSSTLLEFSHSINTINTFPVLLIEF